MLQVLIYWSITASVWSQTSALLEVSCADYLLSSFLEKVDVAVVAHCFTKMARTHSRLMWGASRLMQTTSKVDGAYPDRPK
jgi:hypothetical protein